MRLFLIPISTKRTFVYAQRLNRITHEKPSITDKLAGRAAQTWLNWESHEKGWQKQCTVYGNKLFNKIPFEEWGLKSIPPLSTLRKAEAAEKVDVVYPASVLPVSRLPSLLRELGTSRTALHRQRLIYSIIGMPIVAPFAIVPVIPNIPFFYLLYRAFSHWRALQGGAHLKQIADKGLLEPVAEAGLDKVYTERRLRGRRMDEGALAEEGVERWVLDEGVGGTETAVEELLLEKEDAKKIADALGLPALEMECARAVHQVAEQIREGAYQKAQGIRIQKAEEKAKQQ